MWQLTGLAERFPDDPEPEYVSINASNQAAVTLQENNHVVIVDLATGGMSRIGRQAQPRIPPTRWRTMISNSSIRSSTPGASPMPSPGHLGVDW